MLKTEAIRADSSSVVSQPETRINSTRSRMLKGFLIGVG